MSRRPFARLAPGVTRRGLLLLLAPAALLLRTARSAPAAAPSPAPASSGGPMHVVGWSARRLH